MIYRKPNGDLNLDIEAVVKKYPEIIYAGDDDAEQRVISVALVPYLIEELNLQRAGIEKLIEHVSGDGIVLGTIEGNFERYKAEVEEVAKLKEHIKSNRKLIKVSLILLTLNASITLSAIAAFLAS